MSSQTTHAISILLLQGRPGSDGADGAPGEPGVGEPGQRGVPVSLLAMESCDGHVINAKL